MRAVFDFAAVSPEIAGLMLVKIYWTVVGCPESVRDVPALRQSVVFVGHIHCYGSNIVHRFAAVVEIA